MASTKEYLEFPYDGAKKMILVDDIDDRDFLCMLIEKMWEEFPERKKLRRGKNADLSTT